MLSDCLKMVLESHMPFMIQSCYENMNFSHICSLGNILSTFYNVTGIVYFSTEDL